MEGKAKLFKSRKDIDGQLHRGGGGRSAAKARKHKRSIEKSLRQKSNKLCRNYRGTPLVIQCEDVPRQRKGR